MAVSGDGSRALSGAWDDTLLWDLEPGERLEAQELDTLQSGTGLHSPDRLDLCRSASAKKRKR